MSQGRLLDLVKSQCRIFSLNFNPQRLRLGNKILRQRLRGPALAAWYPKQEVSFRDLQNTYKPLGLTTFDEAEDDREEAIQIAKLRGKGRPKKKRTAAGKIGPYTMSSILGDALTSLFRIRIPISKKKK